MSNITNISTATQLHQYTDNLYSLSNYSHKTMKLKSITPTQPKYTNQHGHDPIMPIKDKKDIIRAKDYFLTKPEKYKGQNLRDYTLFTLGINIGLRAGDLLHIHISDVMDDNCTTVTNINIKEQKTIKHHKSARIITLASSIQKMITDYINILKQKDDFSYDNFLFESHRTHLNKETNEMEKCLTVKGFCYIMKAMKDDLHLNYNVATHSCRKSFVYQKLVAHKNDAMYLSTIQKVTGHSSQKALLHYCGIEAEEIADVYMNDVL